MRALAYYITFSCCVLGACVENVKLAADCPPDRPGPCIVELDGGFDSPEMPGARVDGGVTRPPDAGANTPSAHNADGGSYIFGNIGNPSFEFTRDSGIAGDVVALSVLTTNISPWYTCQPIGSTVSNSVTAVRAETGLGAGSQLGDPKTDAEPTNGRTFVTIGNLINLLPLPLLQELPVPLIAGQNYAFAIDTLTTSPEAQLSVEIRGNVGGCLGAADQTMLFQSPPVSSLSWTTVCVRFTAPSDLRYFAVAATTNPGSDIDPSSLLFDDILGGPRLFFDNIRPATAKECPEP